MSVTKHGQSVVHHTAWDGPSNVKLLPHTPGEGKDLKWDDHDWIRDGTTTPPGNQCCALTMKGDRCPKDGVVVVVYVMPDPPLDMRPADFCGTHYGMHRRGKEVPLW